MPFQKLCQANPLSQALPLYAKSLQCHSGHMHPDQIQLRKLNDRIGEAESDGDYRFFEQHLAPAFAMSRASGATETRDTFIDNLTKGPPRHTLDQSITLLENRAVVDCLVEVDGNQYANHRIFVRLSKHSAWKLLAWANELQGSTGQRPPREASRVQPMPHVYGLKSYKTWKEDPKTPYLGDQKRASGTESLQDEIEPVESYRDLAKIAAFLAVMNKNLTLLFRGQTRDYPLLPTLHRERWPDEETAFGNLAKNRQQYWQSLPDIEEKAIDVLRGIGMPRRAHLVHRNFGYARWAVIQHYELWPTPMLDFSTSLRVAATFALGPKETSGPEEEGKSDETSTKEGYLYITGTRKLRSDLMPLEKDDTAERSDGILSIRLNAVCPPSAARPHLQDGVLLGLYPHDDRAVLDPLSNNFQNRLIAKIKLTDTGEFWTTDFPCLTKDALLPSVDPLKDALRDAIGLPPEKWIGGTNPPTP